MTTPTDDDRDLLTVVAHLRAAEGKVDDLRDVLTALVGPTTQEDGNVNYDLHESVDEPGLFYFYENWESGDHLDAHMASPHLQAAIGRLDELVDGDGLTLTRLRRIA